MGLFDFNKRPKSAINRDRAYKSNEPHERAYKRKNKPKNPRYSKYEGGGHLSDFSGNYYSTNDFVGSNNLEQLANRVFGENWEAEDDVIQIEQLVGDEYVVLVPPDRSEWNDMMAQYGDYLFNKTGDSNYDIFVIKKQDYYDLQDEFMSRTEDENYEAGGKVKKKYKYIPNYMLREAEVENKGKTTYIDGKDILDGIYVKSNVKFEEGGRIDELRKKIGLEPLEDENLEKLSKKDFDEIQIKWDSNVTYYWGQKKEKIRESISNDYLFPLANIFTYWEDIKYNSEYGIYIDTSKSLYDYFFERETDKYLNRYGLKVKTFYETEYDRFSSGYLEGGRKYIPKIQILKDVKYISLYDLKKQIVKKEVEKMTDEELRDLLDLRSNTEIDNGYIQDAIEKKTIELVKRESYEAGGGIDEDLEEKIDKLYEYVISEVDLEELNERGITQSDFDLEEEQLKQKVLESYGWVLDESEGANAEYYLRERVYGDYDEYFGGDEDEDYEDEYSRGGETTSYGTSPSGVRSLKSQLPYRSWISMSKLSRKNFLREIGYTNEEAIERISNINNFSDIPAEDKNYIEYNSDMFIYRGGGKVKKKKIKNYKYVPNRMIEAVEVENNGKTTEIDGANILDGIYVKGNVKFEAGGSTYSGWTIGQDLSKLPNKYYFLYNEYTGERKGYFSTMKEAKKEMVRLGYYESGGGVESEYKNYQTGMKVSTETLESMVGRKLNGWNDDKVYHSGILYVKCYLKPEYKVYAL